MAYTYYNPNPLGRFVRDCIPRAISKAPNDKMRMEFDEFISRMERTK